ncbi:MAG: AsmA family protein [Alphaproteobacteria bacterium]|nr:AsmA family protein [Alphaproteobacteria bacterium]
MIRALIVLISLLALGIGAVLIGPSFINWNSYKTDLATLVRDELGRDVVVEGDLSLSLLPFPQLRAEDLKLANVPHGGSPVMVETAAVSGGLAWGSLLSGEIRVTSLVLDQPVVILERYADGSANWRFSPAGAGNAAAQSEIGTTGPGVAFQSVTVNNGTVVYREDGEDVFRLDAADATLAIDSLSGPFTGEISGRVAGRDLILDGRLGTLGDGQAAPVSARVRLADGSAEVSLSGGLDLATGVIFAGTAEGRGDRLADLLPAESGVPHALGRDPVTLEASVTVDGPTVEISDIQAALADRQVSGKVGLALGELTQVDADLRVGRVALDDFLPAAEAGSDTGDENGADGGEGPRIALAPLDLPSLPERVRATLNLAVDVIDYRDRIIRDSRLRAVLGDGELILNQVTAQLPSASEFSLIGSYSAKGDPKFDGVLQVSSTDLRGALEWLGEDPEGVDADHLRSLTLDTRFVIEPEQVRIVDFSASLDRSEFGGGLTLLLRDKPAFGLSATIDRLDLDSYRASAEALGGGGGDGDDDIGAAAPAGFVDPFPYLDLFDANLQLEVGELTYNRRLFKRLSVDATISNGSLIARRIAFGDAAGLNGSVSGTFAGPLAQLAVDSRIDLTTRNIGETLDAVGLQTPPALDGAGAMRLFGTVKTEDGEVMPNLTLEALGGRLSVEGSVVPSLPSPTLDLAVNLDHGQGRRLLALVGIDDPDLPVERVRLQGTVATAGDGYDVDTTVQALDATASFKGTVTPDGPETTAAGALVVNHPEFRDLVTMLSPGYAPRSEQLGPWRLAADITREGSRLTLDGLVTTVGDRRLEGAIAIDMADERPRVVADLASPRIVVDDWLPADVATPTTAVPVPAVAPGPDGWSRDPIDLSALEAVDGRLDLSAKLLTVGSQRLEEATVEATLDDGRLVLRQVSGDLFGGRMTLNGSAVGGTTPVMEVSGGIKDADLGAAATVAGEDGGRLSGTINLDYDLETRGASEFDLVSNLTGAGLFVVTDGAIDGFDLPSVSEKLKSLNRATDFVILAQKAFSEGSTPFSRLEASFVAEKGAITTRDAVLVSDSAAGNARGTVDLPRRSIEGTAEFSLVEHPNAPPFGVRITGPLEEPRQIFQFEEIQAYILSRGLGSLIDQLAPKRPAPASEGPAVTPAPAKPVRPAIPVRPLENLLRGLTGQDG